MIVPHESFAAILRHRLTARDVESMEQVKVDDFETGNAVRQDLRLKHSPREVIFIFEKVLE